MNLTQQQNQLLDSPMMSSHAHTRRCCQLAQELTEAGDYEAAHEAFGALWPDRDAHPQTTGLAPAQAAEVLLRAGALAGLMGGVKQIAGAQERAKDLLSESMTLFAGMAAHAQVAEAQSELAYCYFRQGAHDEARVLFKAVLALLTDAQPELKATALLRSAMVEAAAARFGDALNLLTEAAPLFARSDSDVKKGRFHTERAIVLQHLSAGAQYEDYVDRALVEYAAAKYHFEQAGHTRNWASVENNLGFLHFRVGRYAAAHEHLDAARRLFVGLNDLTSIAQVDETRARVLLAEGRAGEAEQRARAAVQTLERGDQQGLLAEALTTYGAALARTGRPEQAHQTLVRACTVAEQAGELEGAGRAELTLLEELAAHLTAREVQAHYLSADQLLAQMQDPALGARLRSAARQVVVAAAGGPVVAQFIAEANARHGKRVQFAPAAVAALGRLPFAADEESLRALVERTVTAAAADSVITEAAVEVLALRQTDKSDLTEPWADFSFKEEVQRFEERLIEQALKDTRGMVSHAARLLGFRHHETLNWRLKNRNKNLADARKPITPRRRSIIRPEARKRA